MEVTGTVTTVEPSPEASQTILGLMTRFFSAYFMLVVIIFGFVGNIVSITIFIRQRNRNSAASVYLICLAFSDTGNLIMSFQSWLHNGLFYITDGGVNIASGATDLGCQLRIFVWNTFVFMSAYIIIAYSIERSVAVWWPLKIATLVTGRRRNILLILMLIVGMCSFLPAFWVYITETYEVQGITRRYCSQSARRVPKWVQMSFGAWLFNINMTVPVLLVFIVNALILIGVTRAGKDERIAQKDDARKDALQKKLVKNLLVVSSIFFLTMAPYVIFRWINYVEIYWPRGNAAYLAILNEWSAAASNFIVFNYAVNFIIYSSTLQYFRDEFMYLFCRRAKNTKATSQATMSTVT